MLEKTITLSVALMMASAPAPSTVGKFDIKGKNPAYYAIYEDCNSEGQYVMDNAKLKENINRLKSFLEYTYDWNGNGALPFQERLINKGENILRNLSYQPDVFPTANNSIQLEYEKANGEYLEFEIFEEEVNLFRINADKTEEEKDNIDLKDIIEYVKEFYEND